jgi:hypothetical protein
MLEGRLASKQHLIKVKIGGTVAWAWSLSLGLVLQFHNLMLESAFWT